MHLLSKQRVSCICYLSNMHFVRDIPSKLHRQLLHQHHLQCHLHCGNDPRVANHNGIPSATHPPAPLAIPFTLHDPTVANHNGILSTAHARNTGETPFTMRNRSEHDAPMIRPHTRPSRTRCTAEVDHRGSGRTLYGKT